MVGMNIKHQAHPRVGCVCRVCAGRFVQRLMRWSWLQVRFETLGGPTHLGVDAALLRRGLGMLFDGLVRVQSTEAVQVRSHMQQAHAAGTYNRHIQ